MRNEQLTRVEGSGIDCRTVGACWLCGVHDKKIQTSSNGGGGSAAMAATCREIVGLAKFQGWTEVQKNGLVLQVGFHGGVDGCGGQWPETNRRKPAGWIDGQAADENRATWCSVARVRRKPKAAASKLQSSSR